MEKKGVNPPSETKMNGNRERKGNGGLLRKSYQGGYETEKTPPLKPGKKKEKTVGKPKKPNLTNRPGGKGRGGRTNRPGKSSKGSSQLGMKLNPRRMDENGRLSHGSK